MCARAAAVPLGDVFPVDEAETLVVPMLGELGAIFLGHQAAANQVDLPYGVVGRLACLLATPKTHLLRALVGRDLESAALQPSLVSIFGSTIKDRKSVV